MTRPTAISNGILLYNAGLGLAVVLLSLPWAGAGALGLGFATAVASLGCGPAWWGRWARALQASAEPAQVRAD